MRQFLEHVTGLSIYPLISFVIFSVFFVGMLVHVALMSKKRVHHLETMPLEDHDDPTFQP